MRSFRISEFKNLVGKTLKEVSGLESGSGEVRFECADGELFRMTHHQECCEEVYIESVVFSGGDDLTGAIVYEAEEIKNWDSQDPVWTFYKLKTSVGYVDIRWYGESNGYYSEEVCFEEWEIIDE